MADASKLNIDGTTYNIKDETARSTIASYIGMVIQSTTLDTAAKVKAVYGGTTWIQHSGYVLRGATTGVTANSAQKTGGADSVSKTPNGSISSTFSGTAATLSHSGGAVQNHKLTINEIPNHSHGGTISTGSGGTHTHSLQYGNGIALSAGTTGYIVTAGANATSVGGGSHSHSVTLTANGGDGNHNHGFTQPNSHSYTPSGSVSSSFTGSSMSIDTVPNYKSVYIWERTA